MNQPRRRKHTLGAVPATEPQFPVDGTGTAELPLEESQRSGKIKKFFKRLFLTVLVVILVGGGWFGWRLWRDASRLTGDNNPWQVVSALWPKAPATSDGRINILIAGYSVGDPGHDGAQLTDSIMVLSIDPDTKKAVTLSIPRDLWVNIPGNGYGKINSVYEDGQQDNFSEAGYADGGMGLLEKVVQQDFGITSNYYALVNYAAFRDLVNAVGGVNITVKSTDPRGLYDPYTNLKLPNGTVALNGQQALNLARSRGDGPGSYGLPLADFDRTQHQRQLLIAIKDKVGTGSLLLNPFKVLRLADALGANVKTDMKLNEMEGLYNVIRKVPDNAIVPIGLNDVSGKNLLMSYSGDGSSALAPAAGLNDYSQIQAALNQAFTNN